MISFIIIIVIYHLPAHLKWSAPLLVNLASTIRSELPLTIAFRRSRRANVARHSANVQGRKMKMLLIHEFLYFISISLRNWIATYKE